MSDMRSRPLWLGVITAVALVIGGVTVVHAATSSPTVKVCVTKKNVVVSATTKSKCPKGTKLTSIAVRGPQGLTGPQGPAGATVNGAPGTNGLNGVNGAAGHQSTAPVLLPHLQEARRTYNDATKPAIRIIGLGSSVGVAATVPDKPNNAPSGYFANQLNATFNRLGNMRLEHTNGSVNGTVLVDALGANGDYADAKTAAGGVPTVTVLSYGMNEGTPYQYHTGQTYPGVYKNTVKLIEAAQADGSDVVVMTSPHPHTGRFNWAANVTATYPSSTPVPALTASESVVRGDFAGTGTEIPVSYRHLRTNEAMRQAAYDCGVPVIDVEAYWFRAVAERGEDALYNAGESVHPNLLGHELSFHAAIDDFLARVG